MLRTPLCDRLGLSRPIVQAPMGGAGGPRLAAAVAEAGGLGMLPLWRAAPKELRAAVQQTRKATSRPFGVNLNLQFPQEALLEACLEESVPVISFFWGDPGPMARRARDAGAVVMSSVGDADTARRHVDEGAEVIVAQGWEAGGHVRGMVATLPLVPTVVDAVGPEVPVIAAGGIADGRGLAAVLMLGAQAAWIGTRFLSAEEAGIHPEYVRRLLESGETATVHLENLFDVGWPDAPHRALRNSTVDAWEAAGRPPPGDRPGEGETIATSPSRGEIVRYRTWTPTPEDEGEIEALSMWAGQGVGLVRRVQPAAEIVDEIMAGAEAALKRHLGSY